LRWCDDGKETFVKLVKNFTNLKKVKFEPADKKDCTEGHKLFKKEIEFFINKIKKCHKAEEDYESRIESCSNDHMFE